MWTWIIILWIYEAVKNNFLYIVIGVTFFILLMGLIQIHMKLEDIEHKVEDLIRDLAHFETRFETRL